MSSTSENSADYLINECLKDRSGDAIMNAVSFFEDLDNHGIPQDDSCGELFILICDCFVLYYDWH